MKVFFSVGEPSGDRHAARLITELRRQQPDIQVRGYGGPLMEEAGCQIDYPLSNLAVMGLVGFWPQLRQFWKLVKQAEEVFHKTPPDAVILVDYPGFNWWIAKKAKRAGVRVFYYLPPQLWAWAPWRIRKVRKYVDHVLSVLPFERDWYAQHGVDVEYVGHPFYDEIAEARLDEDWMATWTSADRPIVALLPGSRKQEIDYNWPLMVEVAQRLYARHPDVVFPVACYRQSQLDECRREIARTGYQLPISCFVGKTAEIISIATCCLMVSGSTSLEMLARRTPAMVIYRCSWLFYVAARMLIKCKYMSLPNLIAQREVMPEVVSVGNPVPQIEQIVEQLDSWLTRPQELQTAIDDMTHLRSRVFETGATDRTAGAILSRLPAIATGQHAAA